MADKTQDDCRIDFIDAMEDFHRKLDEIDYNTPWSETPPEWWLNMMNIYRDLAKVRKTMSLS